MDSTQTHWINGFSIFQFQKFSFTWKKMDFTNLISRFTSGKFVTSSYFGEEFVVVAIDKTREKHLIELVLNP